MSNGKTENVSDTQWLTYSEWDRFSNGKSDSYIELERERKGKREKANEEKREREYEWVRVRVSESKRYWVRVSDTEIGK